MLDPQDPRFRPEARVIRLPEWRHGEQGPEMWSAKRSGWVPLHPIFVAAMESIRDGGTFEDAVHRALSVRGELNETHIRIYLRRHYWQLRNDGHIEIPLEQPPDVFQGRYRRLKELGRGGMGVVHLCQDERAGRQVVVKHAWGWLQPIDRAERQVRAEAATLALFDHPGIPQPIETFERDGLLHIVRAFVDGMPLSVRVGRDGPLDLATRTRLVLEAGRIVQHMHERGQLFLDLTPGNFLQREGAPLSVIDVGSCRPHRDGVALSQAQIGSRGYASPEAVERHDIGVHSDVYGLAALHLYLLTGKAPAHKPTAEERRTLLEKLDAPEAERALLADAWQADHAARPTLAEHLRRLEALL